uniref:Uncharacterized protein n=1 Tax=Molossus molossus TaxID=27622 RepID=A0A7J8GLY2_MOLMO|nr:hypothetical protein HJG59_011455 [Molossus molossus]
MVWKEAIREIARRLRKQEEKIIYKGANLTTLWEALQKISPIVQVQELVQTMYSAYQNISNSTRECWVCLPFQEKGLLGIPVPRTWSHTGAPPGPSQTLAQGPITINVFLGTRGSNVTCLELEKVSSEGNPVGSLNLELCTSNLSIPNNSS